MHSISVVILHSLVGQLLAQDGTKVVVDNLVDELIDLPIDEADLAETTLALQSTAPMSRVKAIQAKLKSYGMPPSPLQEYALTAMGATQTCGARDPRALAQMKKVYSTIDPLMQQAMGKAAESIKVDMKNMAGVSPPLGFWDPVGFTTIFNGNSALLYLREAELKHGRVCMLSFLGIIMGEKYHPFFGGEIDLPAYNARAMLLETGVQQYWFAALVLLGALEVQAVRTSYDMPFWEFDRPISESGHWSTQPNKKWKVEGRLPGDLGFDPLNLKPKGAAELKEIQTKEINNGRLAMLAVAGILAQEIVTGQKTFF